MVRVIICHQLNTKNNIISGSEVSRLSVAIHYAGAGLLAHVVTGKYADHLPLYRQSEIYRRQGVEVSRATLGCQRHDF